MRFVLTLASVLTVTLLIFNGYANGPVGDNTSFIDGKRLDPISKAKNVSLVIEDSAALKRKELEEQL